MLFSYLYIIEGNVVSQTEGEKYLQWVKECSMVGIKDLDTRGNRPGSGQNPRKPEHMRTLGEVHLFLLALIF